MARDPHTLLDEALQLPSEARAHLAAELLRSLDDEDEPLDQAEYDAAWGAVIERRLREVETGAVKPGSVVRGTSSYRQRRMNPLPVELHPEAGWGARCKAVVRRA